MIDPTEQEKLLTETGETTDTQETLSPWTSREAEYFYAPVDPSPQDEKTVFQLSARDADDNLVVVWEGPREDMGELAAEVLRLRADLAAATGERDRLREALEGMIDGYQEWDIPDGKAVLRPLHRQTTWIQRAHAALTPAKGA